MNYDKIVDQFVKQYINRGTYASDEQITILANKMKSIILNNKDATPEELVEIVAKDAVSLFEDIRKKYGAPGYTAEINVDNINVKLYGGNINFLGEPMPENAIFDLASMTKFYTQIITYNLIKEGVFRPEDKIIDLDNRFLNMADLSVSNITTFETKFQTPGRIDNQKTIEEALDVLYKTESVEIGKYNYNDIGMMVMKEVMEKQTGLSYDELFQKYIAKPLELTDTHLIVPNNKYHLLTGSPINNAKQGLVNDTKAVAVGGYSGHAGMWASSADMIKLMRGVYRNGVVPNIGDAYAPGINSARGIMGNTFTAHPEGIDVSYVDIVEPLNTITIQGGTRVNATGSGDSAHTVMFNPSSMSTEDAREKETEFNKKAMEKGKNPKQFVKKFEFDRKGKLIDVTLIDSRQILPSAQSVEKGISKNAEITIMLRFFNKLLKEYYHYYGDVEVKLEGKNR